jgi:hypothetical protein
MQTDPHVRPIADLLARLLGVAWDSQKAMAIDLGADEGALSKWLSGERPVPAAKLRRAITLVQAKRPGLKPRIAEWVAEAFTGQAWSIRDAGTDPTPRSYLREVRDAASVQDAFHDAVERCDDDAVEEARLRGHVEIDEQAAAARQEIVTRRGPQGRFAFRVAR